MCDCLVALGPASGGPAIFAKNSDRPAQEAQRLEWHPAPVAAARRTRTTYLEIEHAASLGVLGSRPDWMWGFEHGVNDAGVACGNETIYTTLDPRGHPAALTGMDLVRLGLESAATGREAVETITTLLERHGQGGSGHRDVDRPYWSSFLVADRTDAWVIETSGREWAVEQVDRTWAISNRTTIPSFDAAHRHPRQPVERLVDPRLQASRAVLAREPVTTDAVRRHLRSHAQSDDGWTVCMHVEGVEATTASLIAQLPGTPDSPPRVEVLAGSPCSSVYVPLFVGHTVGTPVAWERFAALDGLRRSTPVAAWAETRAMLDVLEASLAADASPVPGWPDEAWQRVDQTLRTLGV